MECYYGASSSYHTVPLFRLLEINVPFVFPLFAAILVHC